MDNVITDKIKNPSPPTEGETTKAIDKFTGQIPSVGFLSLALGSMVLSAGIALFTERKSLANFIGMWVPTFMIAGLYNKLVKLEGGSDFTEKKPQHLH